MDEYRTVNEAARELGISHSAMHARIQRGDLQVLRVNARLLLIPVGELEQWRGKGKLKPGPKPGSKRTKGARANE